jgi:hypothetical protein
MVESDTETSSDLAGFIARAGPGARGEESTVPAKWSTDSKKKKGGGKKDLSPWMIHLKNFYEGKKEQDPEYKYSQAMQDAKHTYNK